MKIEQIATPDLLAYSQILENLVTSNREIQREATEMVFGKHATQDELSPIMGKSIQALREADEKYIEIQKELDMRMKRDLGMNWGIRKSQAIIVEFEKFSVAKNEELLQKDQPLIESAKRISEETIRLNADTKPDTNADNHQQ